jgi:spore germination cell wall hydrolase CwlJ-like protein
MKRTALKVCLLLVCAHSANRGSEFFGYDWQVQCLADAIYFESAGQPVKGQVAVGHVVLNRARLSGKPVCDVIAEKRARGRCQFNWYCVPPSKRLVLEPEPYQECLELAERLIEEPGELPDPTRGATFFHSTAIDPPGWTEALELTARIGQHAFYREPVTN